MPFEIRTKMSSFQMIFVHNGSHFVQTIWKPDHLPTEQLLTIWIPDYSGIHVVTVGLLLRP